jgi:hypothetical protein
MNNYRKKTRSESISSLSIDSKSESYDNLYELDEQHQEEIINKERSKKTSEIEINKEVFIKRRSRETQLHLSQSPQIEDILKIMKTLQYKQKNQTNN